MKYKDIYSILAGKGRHGDTELAHITKDEANLLKALGGSGTINPETGLKEYFLFGYGDKGKDELVHEVEYDGTSHKIVSEVIKESFTGKDILAYWFDGTKYENLQDAKDALSKKYGMGKNLQQLDYSDLKAMGAEERTKYLMDQSILTQGLGNLSTADIENMKSKLDIFENTGGFDSIEDVEKAQNIADTYKLTTDTLTSSKDQAITGAQTEAKKTTPTSPYFGGTASNIRGGMERTSNLKNIFTGAMDKYGLGMRRAALGRDKSYESYEDTSESKMMALFRQMGIFPNE